MNRAQIYERILLGDCLDKLKSLRDDARNDQWYLGTTGSIGPAMPHDLCVVSDKSEQDYEYTIQRSREVLYRGIVRTVITLIKEYGIEAELVPSGVADAKVFAALDQANVMRSGGVDTSRAASIVVQRDGARSLYVFKRFGIGERWPMGLVDYVQGRTAANKAWFVSLVDENAYLEQINHNDDGSDPTRGTGVISLRQFFDMHFPPEEYSIFRKYLDELAEETRAYYGYRVIKSLSPNAACLFRSEAAGAFRSYDYASADKHGMLSDEQKEILDSQFFGKGTCEALTGTSDFASSFMTAEWLYQSLNGSDRIDLTPIVMDYYKAVEQYMFQFLCQHTEDVDGKPREVYVLKRHETRMTDKAKLLELKNEITLSGLTGFFGHRKRNGHIKEANKDLLREGILPETYELIVDTLESIPVDRNGYFHKDNLYDWDEAKKARAKTLFTFYLLLGSYVFSKDDEAAMGMCLKPYEDDFNLLCDYVNERSHTEGMPLRLPVFYVNGRHGKEDALVACANAHVIGYDEKYGIPQYLGVCFKCLGQSEMEKLYLTKDQVYEVEQGRLIIDRMNPGKWEVLFPEETIYRDGKYLLRS